MLQFMSSPMSMSQRVLLVAACAAAPIALLLYLFADQAARDYRFTAEELKGAAYVAEIWPSIVTGNGSAGRLGAAGAREFRAERQASAFLAAPSQARLARGADFIQAVADGSNLTLDTDLGSFYAMDAATVAMPRLLETLMSPEVAAGEPMALGKAEAEEQAVLRDLGQAVGHLPTAEARSALTQQPGRLAAAFDAFRRDPQADAGRSRLVGVLDSAWRADNGELMRLLQARRRLVLERLFSGLALIGVTLSAAAALAAVMTRRVAAQLKALLKAMDRINAGDTEVQVPHLGDSTETGRIAATLEAFRRGLIQAQDERRRTDEANARYRMLADNTRDIVLHYDAAFELTYVSPSVRQLGYSPESAAQLELDEVVHPEDIEAVRRRRAIASQGGDVKPLAARLRLADGRWRWFESTLTTVRDEDGAIAGFISTFRDIDVRKLAEQALIDSEARYRMLAENVSDVLLRYGPDSTVEYVSPSVRQWGYEPADFIGRFAGHYVHPDDHGIIVARREAMLRGEPAQALEIRIRRTDGTWAWAESKAAYIRGPDQAVIGVVLALRDISARKAADAALVDSEARYRVLAEHSSDVLLRYGPDLRIEYVSPSVSQWGYTAEAFIGQRAGVFVHPDDEERVARRRSAMLQGDEVESVEARIRKADGSFTWIESNPALIKDDAGAILGVVLVLRDINQRKLAEAALIESEARYRMLADNTSDIIQQFDADGVVQYVSPSVRQLGYEPEFFIGRPPGQLVAPENLAEVTRRRQELLSGKRVPPSEARTRTADGRMVWLESRPSPIVDDQGKLLGVVNVLRDVTERKAAESALQELNLELRRVARASALGAFAASLAHEINQPLAAAAVNGDAALRWLTAEPPNHERGLQATGRAVEAVRRAADVVGRLRALLTKEEPNRTRFDAHDAIVEVLALIAREVERSAVTLHARLDAGQPLILGDRVQFQQVIINLILNAIEALREVEGERLLVVGSRDGEDGLEIYVEDRGPGIPPEQQSLIFESMFTTKIGGTGLGLAIARSIVESLGGDIAMSPASPRGAVFQVRLPRVEARAEARAPILSR